MAKHKAYVNASIIAGIIAALALSSTYVTTNSVSASLGSAAQQKNVKCDNGMHTQNYCDGYHIGKGDCEDGAKYRGDDKHHTKDWRSGYFSGYYQNC